MLPKQTTRVIAQRAKRLWVSVVHQAIDDAKGHARFATNSPEEIRSIQREALTWIFLDRSNVANSFQSICDILDIDADWAHKRLCRIPAIRRGLASVRLGVGKGEG